MENNHKDDIKMRILSFIIGALVGAIISTSAFIVSVNVLKTDSNSSNQPAQMQGGTPPEMPSGGNSQNGQPPAMPGENNSQENSQNSNES